jgi:hypothetical protein
MLAFVANCTKIEQGPLCDRSKNGAFFGGAGNCGRGSGKLIVILFYQNGDN